MWIDSGIQRRELHRLYTLTVTKFRVRLQYTNYFVMLNEQNLLYGTNCETIQKQHHTAHKFCLTHKFHTVKTLFIQLPILEYAHTIACINESHYHYRILGSGTLSSKFRPKQFDTDSSTMEDNYSLSKTSFMVINGSDLSVQTTVGYSIRWNLYPRLQNIFLSTNYSCDTKY